MSENCSFVSIFDSHSGYLETEFQMIPITSYQKVILGVPVMLKLRHNLRWQTSAFFLYVWYTICVDGMASDILSKDNFLRVGITNRQHLPITVITIQEKKVLLQ